MDTETYSAMRDCLVLRETRIYDRIPGFRARMMLVITTLLNSGF